MLGSGTRTSTLAVEDLLIRIGIEVQSLDKESKSADMNHDEVPYYPRRKLRPEVSQ